MPVINIIDDKCIVEWFLSLFKKHCNITLFWCHLILANFAKTNSASIYVGEVIQSFCDFMRIHVENLEN